MGRAGKVGRVGVLPVHLEGTHPNEIPSLQTLRPGRGPRP